MTDSTYTSGGDKTTRNVLRNPLKGRYSSATESQTSRYGSEDAPISIVGSANVQTLRQVVYSYGHPTSYLGRTAFDIGGEFLSLRAQVAGGKSVSYKRRYGGSPAYIDEWNGRLYANYDTVALLQASRRTPPEEEAFLRTKMPVASTFDMYRDGTTAIARTAPTNPLVDLSTSLAELYREGLPSIPGRGGNVGGEYLNVQFGILPLASDVQDMRLVAAQSEALIEQYERDSGKRVRRRYEFEPRRSSTTQVWLNSPPVCVPTSAGSFSGSHVRGGMLSVETETIERSWFSGAFTYYLPKEGWRRDLSELDRLYGVVPGIDTLYQLTPWSWLVDYFTNLGDVVSNLNAFAANGLVMPYAYIMSQKDTTVRSALNFERWDGSGWVADSVFDTVFFSSKRRLPAHPFGFGISDSGLTGKQMSILVALGLSRK